jgi:steroid 5-alpha reductase family enzyme
MATVLPTVALAVFIYMTALFLLAWAVEDNSIVDVAWGPGFVLVAWLSLALGVGAEARPVLITGLVTLWGVRLALHIYIRNRGRGEDFRYAAWRAAWGRWFRLRSFLQVFMLQGAVMLVVAWEVVLVNTRSGPGLGWLDLVGQAVWSVGFYIQAVADAQLFRFTRDPASEGKVLDTGLWRYSRHPNYFGEALMWWGIFLMALQVPDGWQGVVSPIVMTFLLIKVSGVTMLERDIEERRPEYRDYIRKTSAFVPWPPKD